MIKALGAAFRRPSPRGIHTVWCPTYVGVAIGGVRSVPRTPGQRFTPFRPDSRLRKQLMVKATSIAAALRRLRDRHPLVQNITNFVSMNTTANALLALGASPLMAHARSEIDDLASVADGLVINIGTLDEAWLESMTMAAKAVRARGKPLVLDPVGASSTRFRLDAALELIRVGRPAVVRGNASEIMALAGENTDAVGVDSFDPVDEARDAARSLSRAYGCAVVASGPTDIVIFRENEVRIGNGHSLMPLVTALGCTATALCGAFAVVTEDPMLAAASGMAVLGIAGEMAGPHAKGPGSLQVGIIDEIANLKHSDIERRLRLVDTAEPDER